MFTTMSLKLLLHVILLVAPFLTAASGYTEYDFIEADEEKADAGKTSGVITRLKKTEVKSMFFSWMNVFKEIEENFTNSSSCSATEEYTYSYYLLGDLLHNHYDKVVYHKKKWDKGYNNVIEMVNQTTTMNNFIFCPYLEKMVCVEKVCKKCEELADGDGDVNKKACALNGDGIPKDAKDPESDEDLSKMLPPAKTGLKIKLDEKCNDWEDWMSKDSLDKVRSIINDVSSGNLGPCYLKEDVHEAAIVLQILFKNNKESVDEEVKDHANWYYDKMYAFKPEAGVNLTKGINFCKFGDGVKPEFVCGAEGYCVSCELLKDEKNKGKFWNGIALSNLCDADGATLPSNPIHEKNCKPWNPDPKKVTYPETTTQGLNVTEIPTTIPPSSGNNGATWIPKGELILMMTLMVYGIACLFYGE